MEDGRDAFRLRVDTHHDPQRMKDIGCATFIALAAMRARSDLDSAFEGTHRPGSLGWGSRTAMNLSLKDSVPKGLTDVARTQSKVSAEFTATVQCSRQK
jgi:hypothetical protein